MTFSFQLPAFLLPGLTLVVSPLIAVMIDQLQHLPSLLPGAFLSSTQVFADLKFIFEAQFVIFHTTNWVDL